MLGQVATADHTNELIAFPALRDMLALQDAVVTFDAIGCQTAIADQIVAGGGASVLAVTANHPTLHAMIAHHVDIRDADAPHRTMDTGHGRLDIRTYRATADPAVVAWLDPEGGVARARQHRRRHRRAP